MNNIGKIKINNGILQGDTMSPLLFILSIDPILNEIDNIIKGIEIKKDNKNIKINKLVYMDDLKIFINENENAAEIDNKIINLYKNIGMKINESKSGIAAHKNIEI